MVPVDCPHGAGAHARTPLIVALRSPSCAASDAVPARGSRSIRIDDDPTVEGPSRRPLRAGQLDAASGRPPCSFQGVELGPDRHPSRDRVTAASIAWPDAMLCRPPRRRARRQTGRPTRRLKLCLPSGAGGTAARPGSYGRAGVAACAGKRHRATHRHEAEDDAQPPPRPAWRRQAPHGRRTSSISHPSSGSASIVGPSTASSYLGEDPSKRLPATRNRMHDAVPTRVKGARRAPAAGRSALSIRM